MHFSSNLRENFPGLKYIKVVRAKKVAFWNKCIEVTLDLRGGTKCLD
jgi:hypothetical protein